MFKSKEKRLEEKFKANSYDRILEQNRKLEEFNGALQECIINNDYYIKKIQHLTAYDNFQILDIKYDDTMKIQYLVVAVCGEKTIDIYLYRKEYYDAMSKMFLKDDGKGGLFIIDFISQNVGRGDGRIISDLMQKFAIKRKYKYVSGHLGTYSEDEQEMKFKEELKVIYEKLGYEVTLDKENHIFKVHKNLC